MKDINGHKPRFPDLIYGRPIEAEIYIRRIPLAAACVQDEKKCGDFLQKLYKEKVQIKNILRIFY
jgi:hypothetical protein